MRAGGGGYLAVEAARCPMPMDCMLSLPAHPDGNGRADTEADGGGLEVAPQRHIVGTLDGNLAAEKRLSPKQKANGTLNDQLIIERFALHEK